METLRPLVPGMSAALQIVASVVSILAAAMQIVYQVGPWHARHASADNAGEPRSETSEERATKYASIGAGATLILASCVYLFARSARAAAVDDSLRQKHLFHLSQAGVSRSGGDGTVGCGHWLRELEARSHVGSIRTCIANNVWRFSVWMLHYDRAPCSAAPKPRRRRLLGRGNALIAADGFAGAWDRLWILRTQTLGVRAARRVETAWVKQLCQPERRLAVARVR
jgi:hypothetical protein